MAVHALRHGHERGVLEQDALDAAGDALGVGLRDAARAGLRVPDRAGVAGVVAHAGLRVAEFVVVARRALVHVDDARHTLCRRGVADLVRVARDVVAEHTEPRVTVVERAGVAVVAVVRTAAGSRDAATQVLVADRALAACAADGLVATRLNGLVAVVHRARVRVVAPAEAGRGVVDAGVLQRGDRLAPVARVRIVVRAVHALARALARGQVAVLERTGVAVVAVGVALAPGDARAGHAAAAVAALHGLVRALARERIAPVARARVVVAAVDVARVVVAVAGRRIAPVARPVLVVRAGLVHVNRLAVHTARVDRAGVAIVGRADRREHAEREPTFRPTRTRGERVVVVAVELDVDGGARVRIAGVHGAGVVVLEVAERLDDVMAVAGPRVAGVGRERVVVLAGLDHVHGLARLGIARIHGAEVAVVGVLALDHALAEHVPLAGAGQLHAHALAVDTAVDRELLAVLALGRREAKLGALALVAVGRLARTVRVHAALLALTETVVPRLGHAVAALAGLAVVAVAVLVALGAVVVALAAGTPPHGVLAAREQQAEGHRQHRREQHVHVAPRHRPSPSCLAPNLVGKQLMVLVSRDPLGKMFCLRK